MTKKKSHDVDGDDGIGAVHYYVEAPPPEPMEASASPAEPITASSPPRRHLLPALSVGDIIALLTLIVLSAALLLEGYHKDFKDYSKEVIALFAIVVGFLLGRKT